jgi:hypothetical protein
MLRAKAACFLQELHPDAPKMAFSQGWLEKFKDRHGIKSFRRFGESDVLDMEAIGAALPTSASLLMRTQRRTRSTWMKLASVGVSKPTTR